MKTPSLALFALSLALPLPSIAATPGKPLPPPSFLSMKPPLPPSIPRLGSIIGQGQQGQSEAPRLRSYYETERSRPRPLRERRDPRIETEKARLARFAGEQFDIHQVRSELNALSGMSELFRGVRIPDRYTIENRILARRYLKARLESYGYEVKLETAANHYDGEPHFTGERAIESGVVNLIAEARGSEEPGKVIEVSAHYDTARPNVPGADDNGSGLTTVLELARNYRKLQPKKTVRFVITDLEERGKDGSYLHAEGLKARDERIEGAIVLDMIGYAPKGEANVPYVIEAGTAHHHYAGDSHAGSAELANELAHQVEFYGDRKARARIETRKSMPGTADHGAYWNLGIPAVLVAAVYGGHYVNPGYHKPTDTVENMNWAHFGEVAKHIAEGVARLSGARIPESLRGELERAERDRYEPAEKRDHDHSADLVQQSETAPPEPSSFGGWGGGFGGNWGD